MKVCKNCRVAISNKRARRHSKRCGKTRYKREITKARARYLKSKALVKKEEICSIE